MCVLCSSSGWGRQSQERPVSVRALQYSGGWGRQSQERPVSVRALQCSGGWGRQSQDVLCSVVVGGDVSLKRDQ